MCDFKMKEIDDLPDDVLLEVQRRLPPSDLKNATLVKRKWKAVGEHPTLWEKFTVTVYSKENITNLSIKRLRLIEQISINPFNWDVEDWKAFFRAVMGLSRLKKIDGLLYGLKLVEPSLFSKSLAKLEGVAVNGCTGVQIQALLSEMSISTRIKKLKLSFCHLSQLEPGLFGKVLSRLEDLILTGNDTTKDQMEAFLTEILNKSSLKRLVLNQDSLRHMEPELFARALSKVEDVRLPGYDNVIPLEALLTELSFGTHQLKRLELRGGDFTRVVPALVAHVLSRLEELSLVWSLISDDQVGALFTEMSHLTQMKKFRFESVDLSQLEAELFAKAMVGLEDLGLCNNGATAHQMVAFFTELSRNSNLKVLDISSADLSSVDPEVLGKAVTRLEAVNLVGTRITSDQSISLFSEMSRNTQMKKINLDYNNLSSVDPQDFARALIRLEEVSLCECNITHDQALAFFTEMSQNTRLKKLEIQDNLSTVDPEILASAITKIKEVNLECSTLSTEQIGRIFTCLLDSENNLKKLDLSYIDAAAQVDPEIVRKVKDKLKGYSKLLDGTALKYLDLLDNAVGDFDSREVRNVKYKKKTET